LVGDGDEGEDKLEVGAQREGKSPLEIAKFYTDKFFVDLAELNIIKPQHVLSATNSIPEQVEIIKILEQKGFAYVGKSAVYFDTSKLADYGKLSGQKLSDKKTAARGDVVIDSDKKNPADFALWFFLTGRYKNHILHWDSPWGKGFPGWHIECSAISRKLLGQPFDIHTGGVDHIGTHHANEIAQSEAAFGVPLANVWMHGEFLLIDSGRMGKSEGNFLTLDSLKEKGFSPLDYRYMCLQAHYRTQLNFTWESLEAARSARQRLNKFTNSEAQGSIVAHEYVNLFSQKIEDDLDIPGALAIAWKMLDEDNISNQYKIATLLKFDDVFGLSLGKKEKDRIPENVQQFLVERLQAKAQKDFKKSDELRVKIESMGYEVMDTSTGQKLRKKIVM
jgi:cysteinyl-tRNA synthetase